jgi:hypothetical protein
VFREEDLFETDNVDDESGIEITDASHNSYNQAPNDNYLPPQLANDFSNDDEISLSIFDNNLEKGLTSTGCSNSVIDRKGISNQAPNVDKDDYLPPQVVNNSVIDLKRKSTAKLISETPLLAHKGRLSVRLTAKDMWRLVLESLKEEKSSEKKMQIITGLSKLPAQEQNTCKEDIIKTYMDLISLSFFKSISLEEASNISSMLMEISKLAPKNTDLIAFLIILTQAPSDILRYYYIMLKI